jgi:hypothetical protein
MASKRLDAWRPVTIVKGDNVEHTACRRDSHLVKGQQCVRRLTTSSAPKQSNPCTLQQYKQVLMLHHC